MTDWQPIETAPRDGRVISAGSRSRLFAWLRVVHVGRCRFIDGRWCMEFDGGTWRAVAPAPSHWVADVDLLPPWARLELAVDGLAAETRQRIAQAFAIPPR